MRHVPLNTVLAAYFEEDSGKAAKACLERAHKSLRRKRTPRTKKKYVDRYGSRKWKALKDHFTATLGRKCWYTEVKLTGAPLVIDHYRPVCDYWWLAFVPENYRVACQWANSPEHNATHGCAGGKGDHFPLFPPGVRATDESQLQHELPVILDPCNAADCSLLAFQADGLPILNPDFAGDATAKQRVDDSKPLLNLDHPDFNSEREQLCNSIAADVRRHEALPADSPERVQIRAELGAKLAPKAQFSTAARFYLRLHRHLDWVEDLLR